MTATDFAQYRDLVTGEDMPATLERFADPASPDTTGLRLFAKLNGRYMTAQVRGRTVCIGSMPASTYEDVVIEFDDKSQLDTAMRLYYWLKGIGYRRVFWIRNPVTDSMYAVHGGEA